MKYYKAPLRIDFAGGWTDIPYLIKGKKGYVSNIAIKPFVLLGENGLDMRQYPRGTGLSTSTSAKILETIKEKGGHDYLNSKKIREIAEELFEAENNELSWAIGRQDPYSIVFGGFNCFEFGQDKAEPLPFKIKEENLKKLKSNLLLFYSGVSRMAQSIVEQVYSNFNSKESARKALDTIGQCGLDFAKNLEQGNLDKCGEIMAVNWENQKILAPVSSNSELDKIYDLAIKNGALGGKMCGAGGGGAFIFYTKDKNMLKKALEANFKSGFELPFEFEHRNIIDINKIF